MFAPHLALIIVDEADVVTKYHPTPRHARTATELTYDEGLLPDAKTFGEAVGPCFLVVDYFAAMAFQLFRIFRTFLGFPKRGLSQPKLYTHSIIDNPFRLGVY